MTHIVDGRLRPFHNTLSIFEFFTCGTSVIVNLLKNILCEFYQVRENTNYSIDVDTIFIKSKSKQSIVNTIFFDEKFLYIALPNSILYTKSSMPSELINLILSMS